MEELHEKVEQRPAGPEADDLILDSAAPQAAVAAREEVDRDASECFEHAIRQSRAAICCPGWANIQTRQGERLEAVWLIRKLQGQAWCSNTAEETRIFKNYISKRKALESQRSGS